MYEGKTGRADAAVRASRALLVAFFAVLLCCTLGVAALDKVGVPIPAPLNSDDNPAGIEGRSNSANLSVRKNLNLAGLLSGDLQDALSQKVGDLFPLRDVGLLGYGALQRSLIALANLPTGYAVTPAFYGATYAICWDEGLVVPIASKVSGESLDGMAAMAAALNAVHEAHPEVNIVVDQLWDEYTCDANPTWALETGTYTEAVLQENLAGLLDDGITYIWDPISSLEEIKEKWFLTEHHWTLERALESYSKIGAVLGWKEVEYEGAVLVAQSWFGANARHALYLGIDDELWDLPTDFSNLTSYVDGEETLLGARFQLAAGEEPDSWGGAYDGYDSWYGGTTEAVWVNSDAPNDKTCLVVGLSYKKPLDPYIAENYARVVTLDVVNSGVDKSLEEYIEEYDVDDVVVQMSTSYASLYKNSAGFLGIA